jgi:hypothetical protein
MTNQFEPAERLQETIVGRFRRIRLVVLAGLVVIAIAIGAIFLTQAEKSTVSMPNVVGLTEVKAQQVTSMSGLSSVVVSLGRGTAHPPPPGTVVAEIPKAGAVVSDGSRVQIDVYLATKARLKTGTVDGTLRLDGGPAAGDSMPASGTAIFTALKKTQGSSVKVTVNATGRFTAHIPIGTWKVTASSPQFNSDQRGGCGAVDPITVEIGKRTSVFVQCNAK